MIGWLLELNVGKELRKLRYFLEITWVKIF